MGELIEELKLELERALAGLETLSEELSKLFDSISLSIQYNKCLYKKSYKTVDKEPFSIGFMVPEYPTGFI